MTSETEVTGTDTGQANGKTGTEPKPGAGKTGNASEPKVAAAPVTLIDGKPADEECDECGEPGKGAMGLGLLICAVAGGLLYIGLDLVTGGWLSGKFGRVAEGGGDSE